MDKHILIVDDSASVRKLVTFIVESRAWSATSAADGLTALEIMKNEKIDAIILDINMPRMNGLEFLQQIKSESRQAGIPVIILTTEGQAEEREKAVALGASAYLVKPFKPSQLLDLIEKTMTVGMEQSLSGS